MATILDDFLESGNTIHGYGFFKGNHEAVRYARAVTKRQRKLYERYGKIPEKFRQYCVELLNFVPGNVSVFTHSIFDGESLKKRRGGSAGLLEFLLSGSSVDQGYQAELEAMITRTLDCDMGANVSLFKLGAEHLYRKMDRERPPARVKPN